MAALELFRRRAGRTTSGRVIGGTLIYVSGRRGHRGGLRLYGRADRRVEQPGLGRRHPRRDRRVAAARRFFGHADRPARTKALVAYALFTTAIVFGIATISNDNLQDLKTGQLVGATPWKQQFALVIGVVFGGLVIPPVLDLLNNALGFRAARRRPERARRAAGGADLRARQGRARRRPRLGPDRPRRRIGVVVIAIDEMLGKAASCACRRSRSAWASTCRWR